jgi:hypothetical protein
MWVPHEVQLISSIRTAPGKRHDALDLLRPWIDEPFGDEVSDAAARLEAFRAVVPGRLPDDYAETLLQLHRATGLKDVIIEAIGTPPAPIPGVFERPDATPLFNILYGLQVGSRSVVREWNLFRDRMPPGLVPIGEDYFSNQICIDVSEAGNGRIFHWWNVGDPGPDDENGRPGWGNTFMVATSFTDLCRRLRALPPLPTRRLGFCEPLC